MSDKFDDFVKTYVEPAKASDGGLSLEQEKKIWLEKITEFYTLVQEALADYIKNESISFKTTKKTIFEDLLGNYEVDSATISVGRQIVKLEPAGTFLVGARGRIDMLGPKGTTRFVIVPPNSNGPRVQITVHVEGEPKKEVPSQGNTIPPAQWVWRIATPPPRISYIEVNAESFRDALMGVVNG